MSDKLVRSFRRMENQLDYDECNKIIKAHIDLIKKLPHETKIKVIGSNDKNINRILYQSGLRVDLDDEDFGLSNNASEAAILYDFYFMQENISEEELQERFDEDREYFAPEVLQVYFDHGLTIDTFDIEHYMLYDLDNFKISLPYVKDIDKKLGGGRSLLIDAIIELDDEETIDEVAQLLIGAGIDPNIQDNNGKTALDYAKEYHLDDVIELLQPKHA